MSTLSNSSQECFVMSLDEHLALLCELVRIGKSMNSHRDFEITVADTYSPCRFPSGREILSVNTRRLCVREIQGTRFLAGQFGTLLETDRDGNATIVDPVDIHFTRHEYEKLMGVLRTM